MSYRNEELIAKLDENARQAWVADLTGDTERVKLLADDTVRTITDAGRAAGLTPADMEALESAVKIHEEEVVDAASAFGALYGAIGLPAFRDLGYALIDDLHDWAVRTQPLDVKLGTVRVSGTGLLVQANYDDGARMRFRAAVNDRRALREGKEVALGNAELFLTAYPEVDEDVETIRKLLGLKQIAGELGDALKTATYVAGEPGWRRTAEACVALIDAIEPLSVRGRQIRTLTGTQLVAANNPAQDASFAAVREGMAYVLAHGSDRGFDYAAVNATVKAAIDARTPNPPMSELDKAIRRNDAEAVNAAKEAAA